MDNFVIGLESSDLTGTRDRPIEGSQRKEGTRQHQCKEILSIDLGRRWLFVETAKGARPSIAAGSHAASHFCHERVVHGVLLQNGDRKMSNVLRHLISPIAALGAILALGIATPARADLEIQLSTDGVNFTEVAFATSGGTASYTNTFGNITFNTLETSSNSPGTADLSKVLGATLDAINNTSSAQTIYIKLGDTGFTSPTAPPPILVNSHIGGSVVGSNAGNALTFQSYVDPNNGQNTTLGTTPGTQTLGVTTGSFSNDAYATIDTLGSPYSITEELVLTLGASGGELNFSSNTTLTPLPEPSAMAIAGLGALCMIGYGLRRRKAKCA